MPALLSCKGSSLAGWKPASRRDSYLTLVSSGQPSFPAAAWVGRSLPCSEEHPPRRCPGSWFGSRGRTREVPTGTSIRKASAQLQASGFLRSEQWRFLWAAVSLPQSDFSGMFQWLDVGRRQLGAEGAAGSDMFPVAGRRAGLGAVLSAVSALQVHGKEYN